MENFKIRYKQIEVNGKIKYVFDYYLNFGNGRKRRKETYDSKEKAVIRQAELLLLLSQGKNPEPKKNKSMIFDDCKKLYIDYARSNKATWKRDEQSLNNLDPILRGKQLSEICTFDVERHKKSRIESGTAPRTINEEVACLKRFFNRMLVWGHADHNPAKGVKPLKEPPGRVKYLEPSQVKALLGNCPDHTRLLVLFLMMTGMRLGEALCLLWSEVDFTRNVIVVRNSKNGERREVPMTKTLRAALEKTERKCDHVFCTPAGLPYRGSRSIWETFQRAVKKTGLSDLRLHDLRHHFASSLRMKGVDLLDIKEYLGHKSISMTMRYAHVTTKRRQEVIQCLDGDFMATSAVFSSSLQEANDGNGPDNGADPTMEAQEVR